MEVVYDHEAERVKITTYPIGTIFSFGSKFYIKAGCCQGRSPVTYVDLESGQRVLPENELDIQYGTVKILKATLTVREL